MSYRSPVSSEGRRAVGAVLVILTLAVWGLLSGSYSLAAASQDQRQLGEEVLLEALLGPRQLMVRVATGGCTDKDSFKVGMVKTPGASPQTAPHYVLTLNRIKADDCKAFLPNGAPVLFDLQKDLGLSGVFTFSLANKVRSSPGADSSEESFFGIIKKYFTAKDRSS
jgi:hypothetical protein